MVSIWGNVNPTVLPATLPARTSPSLHRLSYSLAEHASTSAAARSLTVFLWREAGRPFNYRALRRNAVVVVYQIVCDQLLGDALWFWPFLSGNLDPPAGPAMNSTTVPRQVKIQISEWSLSPFVEPRSLPRPLVLSKNENEKTKEKIGKIKKEKYL